MRTTGLSVPEVVRDIITRNRSVYDCMKLDIINYTALAVKIQPEVEKQLGNKIHMNTIVVAIKRYADSFEAGERITPQLLLEKGHLRNLKLPVKIVGDGEISKAVTVLAAKFTRSAKQKIEAAKGTAEEIPA